MARPLSEAFDSIIAACRAVLQRVSVIRRETDAHRAILHLTGRYQTYQINLREIVRADNSRKYSYYVIQEGEVVAGFDNAPDPRALRLKYGDQYFEHRTEAIPHFHHPNRHNIELTNEMDFAAFLHWLEQNL